MLFRENFFVAPEEYMLYFEFLEQNKEFYTVVLNIKTKNPQLYLEKCEDPNILGTVRVFIDEESCIIYLNQILKLPFDGIEAKYSNTNLRTTFYFITLALTRFSFYTAGSDFHSVKSKNSKHSFIGTVYLNNSEIELFLNKSRAMILK